MAALKRFSRSRRKANLQTGFTGKLTDVLSSGAIHPDCWSAAGDGITTSFREPRMLSRARRKKPRNEDWN